MCLFTGTYDDSRYSLAQLENTKQLVLGEGSFGFIGSDAVNQDPELMKAVKIEVFTQECRDTLKALETLDFVKQPIFLKLQAKRLDYLRQYCRLGEIANKGFHDGTALRQFKAPDCERFIPALEGKADLMKTWRDFSMGECGNNAEPEQCLAGVDQKKNAPNREEYARAELLAYGWWNCALRYIPEMSDTQAEDEAFQKLFQSAKMDCQD